MSSLAYLTIGKEYHDTNYSHDWFLGSTIYLSEYFHSWNFLGRFVSLLQYQNYWKLALRTFACQKYLEIYWKKWFSRFFVSVHEIEESWQSNLCLVFLFFVGIDNPKSDSLFLFSTWAFSSDVRKSQSILGWLFFFKPHPNPSPSPI